ncbi:hypothetical protein J3R83DRAFT_3135 [Lanmaoa asiatica]|nr:hypothetical protein J3R83DRAFT_3135 [Lanmaoa asiatica]
MPRSPQDVYARLLSSPRGYPLWTPEPSNELLMERQDGLRIGDVGVVIPDDGGFDVFFNICLPRDHPFHRRYGVPEGFTCIDQSELDIRTIPSAENPGRIISSSSVRRVGTTEPSSNAPQSDESSALTYRFSLSPSEGALLILPKGAERYDLLNDGLFLEQASRNGAEWYNYAVNRRHRIINHDALYMITGIYKARSWSVAAFENTTENEHYTANFKQIEGNNTAPMYSWDTTRALDWRVGPHIDCGIPNQAVFIRGFKIALRSGLLGTRISVQADVPSTRPNLAKWSSVVPSNSRLLNSLARLTSSRGNNISQTTTHNEGIADPSEEGLQSDAPGHGGYESYDGMHVEIERIPDVPPAFHPSDAINQYLLRKEPSANIAITHDSHWISLLEDNLLTPEELETGLDAVLSQNYWVVHLERKGAATETKPEKAELLPIENIASRIVSLVLKKMDQDAGLREIGAILHNMVIIEEALRNTTTPLPLVLHGHAGITTFVTFLPGGDRILSASEDGTVRSWSIPDGNQKVIKEVLVLAIVVSSDGRRIATGGKDGTIRIWDVSMSEEISQSAGSHSCAVKSLSFSPDSSRVASGAEDGSVSVWSTTTGKQVVGLSREHVNSVCGICYAPDGKRIASCDKEVVLILEDNSMVGPPIMEKAWSLAWSPDSDGLFIGCIDGSIKYFDPSKAGLPLAVWVCHSDAVLSIALSHNGKFFASASRDNTVRLWETATRYQVGATLQHNSSIHSIAISLDDRQLVSGAWDSCVRLWDLRKIAPSLFKDNPQASDRAQQADARPSLTSERKTVTLKPSNVSTSRFLRRLRQSNGVPLDKDSEEILSGDPDDDDLYRFRRSLSTTDPAKYDTRMKRPMLDSSRVGIHVITKSLAQGHSALNQKQFRREIDALLKLDHINVFPLLGITEVASFPALVFPWVEHCTLTSYIERYHNNLTTPLRFVLINDVATGLQYLHSQSVVHGNLSGSSVLIRDNGRACISEFGLSPLMAELQGVSLIEIYAANGTLHCAAPELLRKNEKNGFAKLRLFDPKLLLTLLSSLRAYLARQVLTGRIPSRHIPDEERALPVKLEKRRFLNSYFSTTLVTDNIRAFLLRCRSTVDSGQLRPSSGEIVEFVKEQLMEVVISHLKESKDSNVGIPSRSLTP